MKAAVLRDVNRPLQVEEVQIDSPGPREVLIRTGASGVCHSDLHLRNYGKKSICVDLREEGRRIVRDLVAMSDVVVENYKPGVMERLGLEVETL